MIVCCVPVSSGTNPYIELVNDELHKLGVEFKTPVAGIDEIFIHLKHCSILHLHWPSRFYSKQTLEESVVRANRFVELLDYASSMKCCVVWTAHNLLPHDSVNQALDRYVRKELLKRCAAVITHCKKAARLIREEFEVDFPSYNIPHPDISSAYPTRKSTIAARKVLKIPSQ